MPHGYTIDVDDSQMLKYSKRHGNGDKTEVQADLVGTEASGGTSWLVNVKDPNGNQRLGKFGTKKQAKSKMKQWMNSHKKGVPGRGKGISGGSGGIPGMDGNGLF